MAGGRALALAALVAASALAPLGHGADPSAPRSAIAIRGEVGPQGLALGHDPLSGEPVPNLAMGVRGGNGSAANPYRIANWTIAAERPSALSIRDTRSHVVVENVRVLPDVDPTEGNPPPACPTGRLRCERFGEVDLANVTNVTVRGVVVDPAVHARAAVHVNDSADVRLGELAARAGPTRWVNGLVVRHSENATVANASLHARGRPLVVRHAADVSVADARLDRVPRARAVESSLHHVHNVTLARTLVDENPLLLGPAGFDPGPVDNVTVAYSELRGARVGIRSAFLGERIRGLEVCGTRVHDVRDAGTLDLATATLRGNAFEDASESLRVTAARELRVHANRFANLAPPPGAPGDDAPAAALYGEPALVEGNAFRHEQPSEGVRGGARVNGPGSDARDNWWNATDGPSGLGNGSGDPVRVDERWDVAFEPWLQAPPATGPGAVDCGVPRGEAGVEAPPGPAVG